MRTTSAAIALALPATLGLVVLANPIVDVLFVHGAFNAAAGALTARLVVIYALGLPLYPATEVLTRALIALHDTRMPLVTNTIQLGLRIAIIAALLNRIGIEAIPTAFAASSAVETVILGLVAVAASAQQVARRSICTELHSRRMIDTVRP